MTSTAATLEISAASFDDIAARLRKGGYTVSASEPLDLSGIELVRERPAQGDGWWLRLRRALDLVAPADGLCSWKARTRTTYSSYREVSQSEQLYRCKKRWGHKGGHRGELVEDLE